MLKRFLFLLTLVSFGCGEQGDAYRLELILDALYRSVQFLKSNIREINLDAVLGIRLAEEQLKAYLEFEPGVFNFIRPQIGQLRNLMFNAANEGRENVYENDKDYAETIGRMMDSSEKLLWYSSRPTNPDFVVPPVPCAKSVFNEDNSDQCFKEILGSGTEKKNLCAVSDRCRAMNAAEKQKDYSLTHQVLYWQFLEMRNCSERASLSEMVYLCSNVLRDAMEIEGARYPLDHQDLLMEQIGLCGMWGFRDFHKISWLDEMLKWQQPSGCFALRAKWHCTDHLVPDSILRTKRREKTLEDGCLSHKTAVALLALTVSLRFEAESLFNARK